MKSKIIIITTLTCAILTGCTLLGPIKTKQLYTYELSEIPDIQPVAKHRNLYLMVAQPQISSAYNTNQIAYTTKPYLVAYYSRNHWTETPAEMIHPLIVQTLQATNYFRAVVSPPYTGNYDYLLTTQINKLQIDMLNKPASVRFSIRLQLVKLATNHIVATKTLNIDEPMANNTPYEGVLAANEAAKQALEQIADFCLQYTK